MRNFEQLRLNIIAGYSVSEEDVRQAINEDIKEHLRKNYGFNITFKNEVRTSENSFIDSKYGDFLIEYKKPSVVITDREREQLFSYLSSLKSDSWGILTNGKELEIYNYDYLENNYILNENYSGEINEEQFKYISRVISNKDNKILTRHNIIEYFGVENNKSIIKDIYKLISNSSNKRTKLLYNEWQKLFHISDSKDVFDLEKKQKIVDFYESVLDKQIDNNSKMYRALFSIQTYYAIVTKMIIFKLITNEKNQAIKKPKFLKELFTEIENNKFFRKNNIVNLVDGDFFSWYLDEFSEYQFDYFYDRISDVVNINTDKINLLFITFYENIFPFHVRHAMGEYYTPLYLANKIVKKAKKISNSSDKSILDPTCGSGIFLISALDNGFKNVYGVDINPLSVLTAKINYLLNNFDLNSVTEIPIYLGDSTYLPEKKMVNGVMCYEYELLTSISHFPKVFFLFPEDIIKENNFFVILDEIELSVLNKNKRQALNVIKSYENFHFEVLSSYYERLIDDLLELEKMDLNSIWLKIIGNYLKSGSLRDIEVIVGNPPWVKWSNLPENYKNKIKEKCRLDGVFSSDTNSGGVDLNISALIAHVSIRDRLSNNGVLGFIMPDSILFNKSFEGFRNMVTDDNRKFYLSNIERWNNKKEKPFDPVSLDFAEYYFTFEKPAEVKVYDRKRIKDTNAFKVSSGFNNHFVICTKKEFDIIKPALGRNKLVFRSGLGLPKRGLYLLKFKRNINDKTAEFYRFKKIASSIKLSSETIVLEKELVFPYIKSNQVDDKHITNTDIYCIFPYEYGTKNPIPLEKLRKKYPKFYKYYMSEEVQASINSSSSYNDRIQKNDVKTGIIRVGNYTYSNNYLVTRDNTKSVFATLSYVKTHWDEYKIPLFDTHINYVSLNEKGESLTKTEMNNYFEILKSLPVKLYIKYSSDARSISSRLYNDISLK